ncbi:hypothetical protein PYL56_08815 [Staphylococcus succinus]|uniref:hypothetical protein n=1 Tax=Staphylococcus succinus TaxID=61015 RepID=UPI00247FFEF1|nr:hypothetical protein [Staphylococcus succinus]MDH9161472.1 hypothetical protein [Staphylococcus succinus]
MELESCDYKRLASYFERYNGFKLSIAEGEEVGDSVKNVVEGIETVFDIVPENVKQIIILSWIDPVSDDLLLNTLEIGKRKLNRVRVKVLNLLADEMVYV